MNTVLVNGNNLYSILSQHAQKDYLLHTEVPQMVSFDRNTLNLENSKSFCEPITMNHNVTLEHAFHEVFDIGNNKAC